MNNDLSPKEMQDLQDGTIEIHIKGEDGKRESKYVTRDAMRKVLSKIEWSEEDKPVLTALRNRIDSISGFFRFCNCSECQYNAYGALCRVRKKQCISSDDLDENLDEDDMSLIFNQNHVSGSVRNMDIPLKVIFRYLLRDYHSALDRIKELETELSELKSQNNQPL